MTGNRMVADRYAILGELGRGRASVVWRAVDTVTGQQVALKEIPPGVDERLLWETRAAGQLNDPNIVAVYDVLSLPDAVYVVMELIEAPTLAMVVAQQGLLSGDRIVHIGRSVLSALRRAHAAGVVHRDVRPSNILVLPGDQVKIGDFGSTPKSAEYTAPEGPGTPAADLWSLGATLFFAAEGFSHTQAQPTRLAGPAATMVSGLLNPNPAGRISVAKDRRRPVALLVVIALVALAGLGVGGYFVFRPKSQPAPVAASEATCAPPANLALVDTDATEAALGRTKPAAERLFSYNYADLAASDAAGRELLGGAAVSQYETVMATVKKEAPARQLVLTSKVVASAPVEISDAKAQIMLVMNQRAAEAGVAKTNANSTGVLLTSTRADGTWKITDITAQAAMTRKPAVTVAVGCRPTSRHELANLRDTVLDAGWDAVETITRIDRNRPEDSLAEWEKVSTGTQLEQYRNGRDNFIQQLKTANTSAVGTVKAAALSELDSRTNTATLLASGETQVTPAAGASTTKTFTMTVRLAKTDQGWKISEAQTVPVN